MSGKPAKRWFGCNDEFYGKRARSASIFGLFLVAVLSLACLVLVRVSAWFTVAAFFLLPFQI